MINFGKYNFNSAEKRKVNYLDVVLYINAHQDSQKELDHINDVCIYSALLGRAVVSTGNSDIILEAGDSLILPPGDYFFSESTTNKSHSSLLTMRIDLSIAYIKRYLLANCRKYTDVVDKCDATNFQQIKFNYSPFVYTNILSLLPYFSEKEQSDNYRISLKIDELLLSMIATLSDQEVEKVYKLFISCNNLPNNRFVHVLFDNVFKNVSIQEMASKCGMSTTTFNEKFGKLFGASPRQWIIKQRVVRAGMLLKYSNLSVSEVCFSIGFDNLSYFIKVFKRYYGVTPKYYSKAKLPKLVRSA